MSTIVGFVAFFSSLILKVYWLFHNHCLVAPNFFFFLHYRPHIRYISQRVWLDCSYMHLVDYGYEYSARFAQTFMCTTSEVKCREYAEAKHPKSDLYTCFLHLKKWQSNCRVKSLLHNLLPQVDSYRSLSCSEKKKNVYCVWVWKMDCILNVHSV